jgi:hypothetical protein
MLGTGSPEVGMAEASARALAAAASGEVRDPEMADAISIIKQIRQRMNATE